MQMQSQIGLPKWRSSLEHLKEAAKLPRHNSAVAGFLWGRLAVLFFLKWQQTIYWKIEKHLLNKNENLT